MAVWQCAPGWSVWPSCERGPKVGAVDRLMRGWRVLDGSGHFCTKQCISQRHKSTYMYMFRCTIVRSFQRANPAMLKKNIYVVSVIHRV